MHILTKIINSILNVIVNLTLFLLDLVYKNDYRRFFVLETIARIPYISYLSVLHLYQSIGRHPSYELMNMHFHQSVNEEYHLLIAEELGGGDLWVNRFFARSLGFFYYWANCALYLFFPQSGYYLMEVVESHAAATYTRFLQDHETELRETKATKACHEYFFSSYSRMTPPPNNTDLLNLYQVFESIRDDELLHSKEMQNCSTFTSLSSKNPGIELAKKNKHN